MRSSLKLPIASLVSLFTFFSTANAFGNEVVTGLSAATTSSVEDFFDAFGFSVVPGSIEIKGTVANFSSADAGPDKTLGQGILLSSGNGVALATQQAPGVGDPIETLMEEVLQTAGYRNSARNVTNYSSLQLRVTSASPSASSLFLMLSSEFYQSDWDIAVIAVNGRNYALLPGEKILRVTQNSNLQNLVGQGYTLTLPTTVPPSSTATFQVISGAPTQGVVGLFDSSLSEQTILFAVGNTGDAVFPTFLLFGAPAESNQTSGGIVSASSITSEVTAPVTLEIHEVFRWDTAPTLNISKQDKTTTLQCKMGAGSINLRDHSGFVALEGTKIQQLGTRISIDYQFRDGEELLGTISSIEDSARYVTDRDSANLNCSTVYKLLSDTYSISSK